MNYKGKKIAITGADGFIGSALCAALEKAVLDDNGTDGSVHKLQGDIRDRRTFDQLDFSFDYLFHFAAPSSQVQFARTPSYCIQTTITGFMNAATAAKRHNIRLVYPSTGLLSSENKPNDYALCKRLCEMYAAGKNMDAIGLRIFATYGPGEGHKRDFASVPYLFARDMVAGKQPLIFGDGEQVRDFIYIDDVVQAIMVLAEECSAPIVDIGSGIQTSFLDIVAEINAALWPDHTAKEMRTADWVIQPMFQDSPKGYVMETAADPGQLEKFFKPQVDFATGIKQLVKHLKGDV